MPTTTLSNIAGVTVYATKAAALSGAVDSGAAFNTWMRAQTSSSSSTITLEWDGWIYIADMAADFLQYTPTSSGFITHKPTVGKVAGETGAVWATKTTSIPCMRNGSAAITISTSNISDVAFTTNAGGYGITCDFNANASQPHDSATYGWAFGFQAAGINRLNLTGITLANARTFSAQFIACDGVDVNGSTCTFTTRTLGQNKDGWHFNGPLNNPILRNSFSTNTGDDAVAFNADEPVLDATVPNYNVGLLAGWTGGPITNIKILNHTMSACYYGIRLLSMFSTITSALIDGVSGTVSGYFMNADPYFDNPAYPGSPANVINGLTVRNMNMQASGAFVTYKPARYYFHSTITGFNFDLTTLTVPSADAPATVALFRIHQLSGPLSTYNFGPASSTIISDDFNRADSGTVGNGWTDVTGSKFSISGNQCVGVGDGSTRLLMQNGASTTNSLVVRRAKAATVRTGVSVLRRSTNQYQLTNTATSNLTTGNSIELYKGVPGFTLLKSYNDSIATTSGNTLLCYGGAIAGVLLNGVYDETAGKWLIGLRGFSDTAVATAGNSGIGVNAASISVPHEDAAIYEIVAADTLTTITVTAAGTDSYGNYIFNAAGNGNAYIGNGTWSTDAGTIDQFGRLQYSGPGTATVTYTVGAVSGSASVTVNPTVASVLYRYPHRGLAGRLRNRA